MKCFDFGWWGVNEYTPQTQNNVAWISAIEHLVNQDLSVKKLDIWGRKTYPATSMTFII